MREPIDNHHEMRRLKTCIKCKVEFEPTKSAAKACDDCRYITSGKRVCDKCGIEKPKSEYTWCRAYSIYFASCKSCKSSIAKSRDKEAKRAYERQYLKTEAGKAMAARGRKRMYEKYKDKQIARSKLNKAIKRGLVVKPDTCEVGDGLCSGKLEGHHSDYSKPLEVQWLCMYHHTKQHHPLG